MAELHPQHCLRFLKTKSPVAQADLSFYSLFFFGGGGLQVSHFSTEFFSFTLQSWGLNSGPAYGRQMLCYQTKPSSPENKF